MRPMGRLAGFVVLLLVCGVRLGWAQGGFLDRYQARLAATQKEQPNWATPLVTVAPRLEQGFRSDFVRQNSAGGETTWNYGNAKGLQLVPFRRVEVRFSPPPFLTHSDRRVEDGFGDVAFRVKYRVYGSNEQRHNAIVSAELGASVSTGKSGNGSCCAILTPTVEAGKGLGRFALITSAGGSLPVSNAEKVGRQIVLNNAVEYRATRLLWLGTEFNTTLFEGGKKDGKAQTFVTPGVIVSRIRLFRSGKETLLLTLGAGEQIALTRASTYNHSPIVSVRVRF